MFLLDVYCVKDRRVTPTVEGTEKKNSSTKSNPKILRVKCAACGITKTRFCRGLLSDPSVAEGAVILSSVADTATELFISKGITYLATIGVEAATYYASEAMKAIICGIKKAQPVIENLGHELVDQLSTKV